MFIILRGSDRIKETAMTRLPCSFMDFFLLKVCSKLFVHFHKLCFAT